MPIDTSRRGLFGLFGGAVAAAPSLGKEIAARLSGAPAGLMRNGAFKGLADAMPVSGDTDMGEDLIEEALPDEVPASPAERRYAAKTRNVYEQSRYESALKMLERYGPPPHVLSNARQAAHELALAGPPPHIAALRSFSDTTKYRLAFAYYYEREVTEAALEQLEPFKNAEYNAVQNTLQNRIRNQIERMWRRRFGLPDPEPEDAVETHGIGDPSGFYRHRRNRVGKSSIGRGWTASNKDRRR